MKIERRLVVFRFNMVEVALALIILAIGLSSVMVLFPVGLRASRSSIADNNLADVAERVVSYIQAESTSPAEWKRDGEFGNSNNNGNSNKMKIGDFDFTSNPSVPKVGEFDISNNSGDRVMDGLFKLEKDDNTYYLYRQYSNISGSAQNQNEDDRAVDFEAMIRVGWDKSSRGDVYYPAVSGGNDLGQKQLSGYSRDSSEPSSVEVIPMNGSGDNLLNKFYRTLIVEISWPADVEWANREKRIFRMEMFNENFVPYPQNP